MESWKSIVRGGTWLVWRIELRNIKTSTRVIGFIKTDASGEFEFYFKVENLKLLDGDYDVKISSKNISNFIHNNGKVEYWIALEPESTYSE